MFLLLSPFVVYFNAMNWCLPSKSAVNRYEAATIRPGYRIVPPFSFPSPHIVKPVGEIAAMKWVRDLAENLAHRTSKQVYLQPVNEKYYELFLNLLVAFKKNTMMDLEKILVVATDEYAFNALTLRGMSVVLIKPEWIIRHYTTIRLSKWQMSWEVFILRQAVVRLLNHWNHDVFIIDADAIPLKDFHALFEKYPKSDIIGSYSLKAIYHPDTNSMCAGFALYKATTAVSKLGSLGFWHLQT